MTRTDAFRGLTTQSQVESRIDRYIGLALRAEARRDRRRPESPAYWRWHDVAVKWHERARLLMPLGS